MAASQTECSRVEQRCVIKFLMTEKCKTSEIYKSICDVYGKACFSLKNVYKWVEYEFIKSLRKKDSPSSRNTDSSNKEKIPETAVRKE